MNPYCLSKTILPLAVCLLTVMLTGCRNIRIREQLHSLHESHIVLPERVTCVNEGEVFPMPDSLREKTKFIVYVDSTGCSRCRISRFVRYVDIFRLSDETQAFVPILLVSTRKQDREDMIEHLLQIELPLPVFFDDESAYLQDNPAVLVGGKSIAVTVDGAGKVLLVGDPSEDEKLMAKFRHEIVDNLF